jgi:hypothetical protein
MEEHRKGERAQGRMEDEGRHTKKIIALLYLILILLNPGKFSMCMRERVCVCIYSNKGQ